jgi:hypothetical protein
MQHPSSGYVFPYAVAYIVTLRGTAKGFIKLPVQSRPIKQVAQGMNALLLYSRVQLNSTIVPTDRPKQSL